MAQNRAVVNSKNGVAQWREKDNKVFLLFKRYTMFLNDDEIDELIHLLEAIQQEMNPNCPFCQEELVKYTETGQNPCKSGV